MTRHPIIFSLSIACALVAVPGFANAEIVQCTSETGAVTFTDTACSPDADVIATGSGESSSDNAPGSSRADNFSNAETARATTWAVKNFPHRQLALDAETVKAARATMILRDSASAAAHQQALAQL